MRHNKAQTSSILSDIPITLIVLLGVLIFIIIVRYQFYSLSESRVTIDPKFETELFMHRILNNPRCFVHVDLITDKPKIGFLQLESMTTTQLAKCFDTKHYMHLTVEDDQGTIVRTLTLNQKGSKEKTISRKPIYYIDNSKNVHSGMVTLEVIRT